MKRAGFIDLLLVELYQLIVLLNSFVMGLLAVVLHDNSWWNRATSNLIPESLLGNAVMFTLLYRNGGARWAMAACCANMLNNIASLVARCKVLGISGLTYYYFILIVFFVTLLYSIVYESKCCLRSIDKS